MGRTGISPRPAPGSHAGQALAVLLAAVALLLSGAVDVLPRSATGAASAGPAALAASSATGPARAAAAEPPASSLGVRAGGLTTVPAPGGPGGGLPPTAGPLVAPHLVTDPHGRPPTSPFDTSPAGAAGSRAPPGPAGT